MDSRKKVWIVVCPCLIVLLACSTATIEPQAAHNIEETETMAGSARETQDIVSARSSPTATQSLTTTPTRFPTLTALETALPTADSLSTTTPSFGRREYYFDSISGDDNHAGTSPSVPWKSLAKMNSFAFQPGDIVNLKRGSSWTGGLIISRSGTIASPILFRAYGEGENPIFENPGNGQQESYAVRLSGSYIVLENILARNASYSGIYLNEKANYNLIRNIEATNVGIGVAVNGAHNLITNNYIHDLKMIVNDVGGSGNDYGAVGVEIFNGPNEISYNRLINCRAPSYDFGYDGGAVEIYLLYGHADNSYFHHNYAENTDGFIEIHSRNLQFSASNVTIAQNLMVNTRSFLDIGLPGYGGGHELKSVQNIRLEHNTFVDADPRPQADWIGAVIHFHGTTPTANQVYLRNNIIYSLNSWWIANTGNPEGGFTHNHNIYYLHPERSSLGFTLHPTEKRIDPQFEDVINNNLRLQAASPAINAGADLGYMLDFDNRAMPVGPAPDIGAYED